MCRKRFLYGGCILCFGLGVMMGYYLESWFWCSFGGLGLVVLGLIVMCRR